MTEQEKQALIEWCEWRIARGSQNTMSEQTLKAARITLAALTAQPVKLSPIIKIGYTRDEITCMCNVRNEDIESIRAAGYEVQE